MKNWVRLTAGMMMGVTGVYLGWGLPAWLGLATLGVALVAVTTSTRAGQVRAKRQVDFEGKAQLYTLNYGDETVALEPGKPWVKTDTFKWVTRGLIEEPQSYQVLPNGAVEINAERILPEDLEGEAKLEFQINKHHPPSIAHKPPVIPLQMEESVDAHSGKVLFQVKLDHLGHMMIGCKRGHERAETGLRGLPALAQRGFMIKPQTVHVDPLQRSIELDGMRFECSATGAQQLEKVLNERYAPALRHGDATRIGIRDNAGSATGFDIEFVTTQGGARLLMKGHLTQERLNILQDQQRCDMLQPGIILRLSPPNLLIRHRLPDGGEEPIPDLPDVHYMRVEAVQLEAILNDPRVRRSRAGEEQAATQRPAQPIGGLDQIRVVHNPQNRLFLWLECHHAGGKQEGKAFTHHNVMELQHRRVFQDHLGVSLSIDNHRLSVLDQRTHEEQVVALSSDSGELELARAAELLTAALKPVVSAPA